jgi:type I restriction enzyme R subunit
VKLAHEIKKAIDQGNELGLTPIELAFYDALTQPQACKDFYHNDELIALTRELTDTLRKNRTVDWTQKSTARAGMRMMVKKLLKKYKYPPEGQEEALDTVIKQCELWADNNSDDFSQIRADIDRDDDDLETNLVATPPVPHNL